MKEKQFETMYYKDDGKTECKDVIIPKYDDGHLEYLDDTKENRIMLLNTLKKDYEKKSTILPKSLLQDLGNFNGIVNHTERIANIQSQASVVENAKNQIMWYDA